MPDRGERASYFPAIERKHGGPISLWIERIRELGDAKYPEQVAHLRENHGFSQAHANALVMYVRGSTTSTRVRSVDDFYAAVDPKAAVTARTIFDSIRKAHPPMELVIAWNHPMLRLDGHYVIGLSAAKHHVLVNYFSADLLSAFADRLTPYKVNKKTFAVPLDWKVDRRLLLEMTKARLAEF